MLGSNQRKLFKKGKLSEKSGFFGYAIIEYNQEGIVYIRRTVNSKKQLSDFLFETFRQYEYEGQEMSARQIATLLGVDHTTVDNIIARAKQRIKEGIEYGIKQGYKKSTIYENIDILL